MLAVAQLGLHVLSRVESTLHRELLATRLLAKEGHGFQEHGLYSFQGRDMCACFLT